MIVYLNGRYLDDSEACISPFDRGFLYGDGFFETLKCIRGKPIFLNEHVNRLKDGLRELNIELNEGYKDFNKIIKNLLNFNELQETSAYVRITVSRGVTNSFKDFNSDKPTVFVFTKEIDENYYKSMRKNGFNLKTVNFYRNFLAEFKHINYLPSVYGILKNRDYDEILFLDDKGYVLEGGTSNIFFVGDDLICTPKSNILKGIYREYVIKTLRRLNIKVEERDIHSDEIGNFVSAFLTNSIIEVMPVAKINDIEYKNYNFPLAKLII